MLLYTDRHKFKVAEFHHWTIICTINCHILDAGKVRWVQCVLTAPDLCFRALTATYLIVQKWFRAKHLCCWQFESECAWRLNTAWGCLNSHCLIELPTPILVELAFLLGTESSYGHTLYCRKLFILHVYVLMLRCKPFWSTRILHSIIIKKN